MNARKLDQYPRRNVGGKLGIRPRHVLAGLLLLSPVARATVITFAEQPAGDAAMSPATYTSAQGLPAGVTATFAGFRRSSVEHDHTPDNRVVYGTNNNPATITFNVPVEVPSLWVNTGTFGTADDGISGSLGGTVQFSAFNKTALAWAEVTDGKGKLIDKLTFTNFQDSLLDDVTVVAPEPTATAIVAVAVPVGQLLIGRSRRSRIANRR